jgi:hypothetical protein
MGPGNGLLSLEDLDEDRRVRFDLEETSGDDDLYFYGSQLTDERNDSETDEIVALLVGQAGDAVLDAPCAHGSTNSECPNQRH